MTSKVETFENVSGFRDGTPKYVSPNLVEIGRCEVAERSSGLQHKKLGLCGTRTSPYFAQNGPIQPKIIWTLSPLGMSTYTEFGPDRLRFAGLIPERLIFWPKKSLQYRLSAYNKRLRSRYYTVEANYREARSCGRDLCHSRASCTLYVGCCWRWWWWWWWRRRRR